MTQIQMQNCQMAELLMSTRQLDLHFYEDIRGHEREAWIFVVGAADESYI